MPDFPLCALLAEAAARCGGAAVPPSAALEAALADLHEATRRALPGVPVEPEALSATLARAGVAAAADPIGALAGVRAADLFLASACAAGEAPALALFEERFGAELRDTVRRTGAGAESRDDVLQELREKLFVGTSGKGPRILDYGGQGELRFWLRTVAVRHVLNHVSRGPREKPVEDALFEALPDDGVDPEMTHMKALYRAELKEAFAEVVRALDAGDRSLLRYAVVDGLGVDAIGALLGVHRSTASRRLQAARDRLLRALRARLQARLCISRREVDSVLRLVESGVTITLERHLGAEQG